MEEKRKAFRYPKIVCSRCGECCRIPVVPVTHKDAARLIKLTGKPANKIVRFSSSEEMSYNEESGLWIKFKTGKYAMVLRKKKSGRCMFQTADHACSAYAARPQTCRTFPYNVEFADETNKTVKRIGINKIMDCNAVKSSNIDLDALVTNVRKENREDKEYHRLVKRWNKSPQSITCNDKRGAADFLRFVGLA